MEEIIEKQSGGEKNGGRKDKRKNKIRDMWREKECKSKKKTGKPSMWKEAGGKGGPKEDTNENKTMRSKRKCMK